MPLKMKYKIKGIKRKLSESESENKTGKKLSEGEKKIEMKVIIVSFK